MTSDERAQLIEDIEKTTRKRQDIVERARLSDDFDIAAAWETLDADEASIAARIADARAATAD